MKNRVLLVSCEGLGNGGVQAVMMNTVRELCNIYDFDMLLFTSEKRYYDDEFLSYGGRIFRVPFYEGSYRFFKSVDYYVRTLRLYRCILRVLKDNGPFDIIHCNNEFESAICLKAAKKCCIPIRICQEHTIAEYGNPLRTIINKYYKKIIINSATKLIGCSKDACNSFYGNSTPYEVIHNPFDNRKYQYSAVNKKDTGISLIQVGAYSENKNQIYTLKMLNVLVKKFVNVHLHFVGFDLDGSEISLKSFVKIKGLDGNVTFWPSDTDIPELMKECDAFIMPSFHEGFGIALIEAQAMGLKCYASDTIPVTTNIGGCEYFNLMDGPEKLAERLYVDYQNGKLKRRKYDASAFSLDRYARRISEIYRGE